MPNDQKLPEKCGCLSRHIPCVSHPLESYLDSRECRYEELKAHCYDVESGEVYLQLKARIAELEHELELLNHTSALTMHCSTIEGAAKKIEERLRNLERERDGARKALGNVLMLSLLEKRRDEKHTGHFNSQRWDRLIRYCKEGGVEPSILREAALGAKEE